MGARRDDRVRPYLAKPVDLPESQPQREDAVVGAFETVVPMAGVDVGRAHLDPMLARIADELRGGIEAHRLRIEDAADEDGRSEEHTSDLQSLMSSTYAVLSLKK